MDILQFLSTFMTADGVSVGLQGVIVFMMIWQQREIRQMRGDMTQMQRDINHRMDAGFKRVDKRIDRLDKRVNSRIDGLAVQVGENNRRVLMP